MVSGFVTSPCDQLRIFSGDARLMRMASKSAIVFCISNGLERNKVFLRFLRQYRCRFRHLRRSDQYSYGQDCADASQSAGLIQEFISRARTGSVLDPLTPNPWPLFLNPLPRWPWAFSPRS